MEQGTSTMEHGANPKSAAATPSSVLAAPCAVSSAPCSPPPAPCPLPVTIIEPRKGWIAMNWKDLWQYRELLYFLTWRDIKVRYKQTVLGALWAIIQPFMSMVVFTVFFGQLGGLNKFTGGVPYPIFVYAGLLPWTLFAQSLGRSSDSVVGSANLITKVYFPRLIMPAAAMGACLVDFAFSLIVLIGMMVWYGVPPSPAMLLMPVFVLLTAIAALGIGTLISALNVSYRDFRYVVPFMIQLWMFITPVIYPVTIVPEKWRWLLALNPMTGITSGCRASLLNGSFDWPSIGISSLVALAAFALGTIYFRRVERAFADIV